MTDRDTQKLTLEKYIHCMSGLIGKAIRERRPFSEIAALQMADIVNRIAHHSEAREAKAKSESAPLFGIDIAQTQDIRMHQAAR